MTYEQPYQLSEHEVRSFLMERRRLGLHLTQGLISILGGGLAAMAVFTILNLPSLLRASSNISQPVLTGTPTPKPIVQAVVAALTPSPTPKSNLPSIPDSSL